MTKFQIKFVSNCLFVCQKVIIDQERERIDLHHKRFLSICHLARHLIYHAIFAILQLVNEPASQTDLKLIETDSIQTRVQVTVEQTDTRAILA